MPSPTSSNILSQVQRPSAGRRAPSLHVGAEAGELSSLGKIAFVSLWLLVFAIPWEDAITIPGFGTSARLIGTVAAVLGVLAVIERGRIRRLASPHLIMMAFVLWAALSYLWSFDPDGTLVEVFSYVSLLAMAWLIWELAPSMKRQMQLMQAYVFGTFVSGLDTAYLFLSHRESDYQRYSGAGLNANDLGLIMALSIPISYYLLINARDRMVWAYRLQLAVAGATVLLTASRGAILASLVALIIVPLTCERPTGRQIMAGLVTFAALICGAIFFIPSTTWQRLATIPTEVGQGTLTGRTVIWTAGWELFRTHPFFGVGAAAFRESVSRALSEPIVAHNTFLSVLVEQGVIGFAVFCALLITLAVAARTLPSIPRKLWLVSLAVWVIGVSSLTWEMRKPTWFFFGLLIAQWGVMAQTRRESARFSASVPMRAALESSLLKTSVEDSRP